MPPTHALIALGLAAGASALVAADPALLGFTPDHAPTALRQEAAFDAQLNPADLRAWLEHMAAAPNHVGTPHDKENAEYTAQLFREWGWDARIERFDVLYPTPLSVSLEMVAPTHFTAKLHEPAIAGDRTSANTRDALPPYHAYGADGDVTAELVYVNRGMPDDYQELERRGISVRGRIVLARYGGGWRGLKPKLAYEHGAVGCLVYSDPADDGYGAGDVYPKGGYRPADGVQRGSVADMPVYAGDPLTPGVGATPGAKRLDLKDAKTVLKIPVMPISYGDAQPLLAALEGAVVPPGWRGALPLTYHFGPGPAKVHLAISSDWSLKPVYDVIAVLAGHDRPDEWILRGNHRDGWVFGAWDPLSGHVAEMAEAKALGALVRQGWRPRRTIVYCSWDGEEPGLLGSTEWAETHEEELRRKAVVYINSDTNTRGFLQVGGSHAYQSFVNEVAAGVPDPETGVSVLARRRARTLVDGTAQTAGPEDRALAKLVAAGPTYPIEALGSGSDFTPFLQHVVLSTLSIEFGGEDKQEGVYHSIYDSFDHYERFGDPGFRYGVTLAQTVGHTVMRLADADVLPARFTGLAETLERYAAELHKAADGAREHAAETNRLVDLNAYRLAADPTETYVPPDREADVPTLDLSALDAAVAALKRSAARCDAALADAAVHPPRLELDRRVEFEDLLRQAEASFASDAGLPGRPWFRHMLYAPGLLTGYGVKTMPGIREAIENKDWDVARHYVGVTAGTLDACDRRLQRIVQLLETGAAK